MSLKRALPLALSLLLIGGCAATDPKAKVAAIRQSYTTALGAAADIRQAGRMSDETYRRVDAAQKGADAVITVLERRAATSQPTQQADLDAAVALINAIVSAMKGVQ